MRVLTATAVATLMLAGTATILPTVQAANGSFQVADAQRPLVSGERVRVKKLARDMESAMQTINKAGIIPFQDPAYAQKWQQSIERFRSSLARFPQMDDPDVQLAHAKLAEMENLVRYGVQEAGKQSEELGDVQAILATIETNLRANRAPQWLPAPFDNADAKAWYDASRKARDTATASIAEMQRIAPTANLPLTRGTVSQGAAYDKQDLSRLMNFAQSIVRDVDESVKATLDNLKLQFEVQDRELEYYRNLDPKKDHDRLNAFLSEGAEAEIYAGLDRQLAMTRSLMAYQRAFGEKANPAIAKRALEILNLRSKYAANLRQAVGDLKLPEPKSKDSKRLDIAREILAEPSYEFGEHGPVVLTTEKIVDREKQVSRAEIKDIDVSASGTVTMSGTETTWQYRWKEFKFATPIKDEKSGKWHIWWITAKNYSSGWERTPIGVWVSGGSTKGSQIPESNF